MPFTFAHPAIILPFVRKHRKLFSATGLIVGSMAPDFQAFIGLTDVKTYSHSWVGIFWYDLPLSIAISFVFHVIVRDPLIDHMPRGLQQRFEKYRGMKWLHHVAMHPLIVLSSLLIGIFSHLLWDGITHLNLRYPDAQYSTVMLGPVRLYIVLQYACSLIGLLYVAWFIYKMPITGPPAHGKSKAVYWSFVALFMALFFVVIRSYQYDDDFTVNIILRIDIFISVFLAALVVVSFFDKFIVGRLSR